MVSVYAVHDDLPLAHLAQPIVLAQPVSLTCPLSRLEKLHLGASEFCGRQILVRHLQLPPEGLDGSVQVLAVGEASGGHQLVHRPLQSRLVVWQGVALFAQLKNGKSGWVSKTDNTDLVVIDGHELVEESTHGLGLSSGHVTLDLVLVVDGVSRHIRVGPIQQVEGPQAVFVLKKEIFFKSTEKYICSITSS